MADIGDPVKADFGAGVDEAGLAVSSGVAGGSVKAGVTADSDSDDASLESEHGFSFSEEADDSCDRADLAEDFFVSVQVGFSGFSAETGDTGAAFAIKEAAKTAPAVSKAERLKFISPPRLSCSKKQVVASTSYGA